MTSEMGRKDQAILSLCVVVLVCFNLNIFGSMSAIIHQLKEGEQLVVLATRLRLIAATTTSPLLL